MKKIAIFDMDGTLIDSGLDITYSINHVRSLQYALEPLSVRYVVDAINAPSRNLAEIFYGTAHYEPEARALFEEHYYDQCIQNVRVYEGINEVLDTLHGMGVVMGVATNAPGVFAKRMLQHLGVEHYFELITGADDVEWPKPHPQMIRMHLERCRYRPGTDRAWMIGDNAKDMEAAAQAGIEAVFAGWGFAESGDGAYCAANPLEILRLIS